MMISDDNNDTGKHVQSKIKRKGVWVEVHTFEHPESGLVCVITERSRGVPAYSFQIAHMDDRGFNKFIPCPVPGDIDVEHIIKSLAENARDFITKKIAENKQVQKVKPTNKQSTKRSQPKQQNGNKQSSKPKGLSMLAQEDARAAGHTHEGSTKRQQDKKRAAKTKVT